MLIYRLLALRQCLSPWSGYNKFINNKHVFLAVREAESLRSGCQCVRVLVRALFGAAHSRPLTGSPVTEGTGGPSWASFLKSPIPFMGLCPQDLLNYPRHHLLTLTPWGFGITQNLERNKHSALDSQIPGQVLRVQ